MTWLSRLLRLVKRMISPNASKGGTGISQATISIIYEVVVATGGELHRHCSEKGILFLFFLGFNTNACILLRDYGTVEMAKRGYGIAILRDCTTGMESPETHEGLWQTRGAILFLEMFGKFSLTSDELIAGLPAAASG